MGIEKTKFKITVQDFEGPLDLLLRLIESEKMDVTKVSLANVADEFLKYLESLENVSAEKLSEFLDVASKIILIKSKVLLPQLKLTEEEQEDIEELEKRLKEYQTFKKLSFGIKDLAHSDKRGFKRDTQTTPDITLFDPPESVDKDLLFKLFREVLSRIPKEKEDKPKAEVEPVVSIEDKINEIDKHFAVKDTLNFSSWLKKSKAKVEVIVGFLAILELLKLKKITVEQNDNFSDIIITKGTAR